MIHLVCYDISVKDDEGPRRLRRVAKYLERYGVRIQKSVFEVRLPDAQFRHVRMGLLELYDARRDSVVIYRIAGAREMTIESHGAVAENDLFARMVI